MPGSYQKPMLKLSVFLFHHTSYFAVCSTNCVTLGRKSVARKKKDWLGGKTRLLWTHWHVTALENNALGINYTQGHALTVFGNDSREKGRHPQESVHSVSFTDTQLKGLRHLFLKVSWNLHAFPNTPDSVLVSLEFQKQCARQGSGLWKGTVSAEKALQGLETEMRGLLNKGEMRGLF